MFARKTTPPEMRDLKEKAEELEERRKSVLRRLARKLGEMQDGIVDGMEVVSSDMAGSKR